ncbi:P granule organization [Homalodisca vitripennis]|nr:P granule organization [Homalodisca vitripennis]
MRTAKPRCFPLQTIATTGNGSDISSVFVPENVLKPNQIIGFEELPQPKKDRAANEPLFEIEVRLGEVISPSMFFIMLDSKYNDLQIMMDDLDKFYKLEQDLFRIPLSAITLNLICACEYEGSWHRAKVTAFKSNNTIEIIFGSVLQYYTKTLWNIFCPPVRTVFDFEFDQTGVDRVAPETEDILQNYTFTFLKVDCKPSTEDPIVALTSSVNKLMDKIEGWTEKIEQICSVSDGIEAIKSDVGKIRDNYPSLNQES